MGKFSQTGSEIFLPEDWGLELSRGNVGGMSIVHKFGDAEGVGTTLTPITTAKLYPTPTAATSLEIVSDDNTNDVPAGTGARKVRVYGLTSWSGDEVTEDVSLNGTTAVALSNDFLRVYRMRVIESGAYATSSTPSHNSTLTLRVASGGATWAQIVPTGSFGLGSSEIACYSVPEGKSAYIGDAQITVQSTKSANVVFFYRPDADTVSAPYSTMRAEFILRQIEASMVVSDDNPRGPFVGPCDIGWMGAAVSTTADITIDFEIFLVDT